MPGPGYAYFDDAERNNVLRVLDNWASALDRPDGTPAGESEVQLLEADIRARLSSRHCLSTGSGTSALLTALAALDIGPGDEVIVPGYMFVASISAIVYAGAIPVLAEIDESLTLDPEDVRSKITPNTKAIMPVHMLGAACDMSAISAIAREHGLKVIEDAAQATGGTYRGTPLGTFGDTGAFSLNIYKVITGGDGGFLLAKDDRVFQRAYSFHDHGWFPYRQETGPGDAVFGLNLRMTELTAAVARAQLVKLDDILFRTRDIKRQLAELIPPGNGFAERTLHDADGDCATLLVHVFDDTEAAEAVARGLGTRTLLHSPKHYYGGIPELPALADGTRRSAPTRPALPAARRDSYQPGALPRTDSVLSRSVAVTVGLHDPYLGAGFGANVRSSRQDIASIADKFRTTVNEVLG